MLFLFLTYCVDDLIVRSSRAAWCSPIGLLRTRYTGTKCLYISSCRCYEAHGKSCANSIIVHTAFDDRTVLVAIHIYPTYFVCAFSQVELAFTSQAKFVSSTFCDPAVVTRTKELGLISIPGVSTVAQAVAAVEAGGDIIKIFPATDLSLAVIQNIAGCIPPDVPFVVAGGVEAEQLDAYYEAGASGFAVGRTLLRPGMSLVELKARARRFVRRGSGLRWTHYGRPREPV